MQAVADQYRSRAKASAGSATTWRSGYVRREESTADRRETFVVLTDEGRRALRYAGDV